LLVGLFVAARPRIAAVSVLPSLRLPGQSTTAITPEATKTLTFAAGVWQFGTMQCNMDLGAKLPEPEQIR
jgi:hypothetical protein